MKLYQIDSNRYYTGIEMEVPDTDPVPSGYVPNVAPPETKSGEYVKWVMPVWEVTTVSPKDYAINLSREQEENVLKTQKDSVYWTNIRNQRDQLLKDSDWTQLADVVLPNAEAWKQYRQDLRDIPNKFNSTDDVIWPPIPTTENIVQ